MKKNFKLEDLDCALCAQKIEKAVGKIDGITSASVSFIGQKITIEAEDDCFEKIVSDASKVIKKIEPDCRLVR